MNTQSSDHMVLFLFPKNLCILHEEQQTNCSYKNYYIIRGDWSVISYLSKSDTMILSKWSVSEIAFNKKLPFHCEIKCYILCSEERACCANKNSSTTQFFLLRKLGLSCTHCMCAAVRLVPNSSGDRKSFKSNTAQLLMLHSLYYNVLELHL